METSRFARDDVKPLKSGIALAYIAEGDGLSVRAETMPGC